VLGDAQAQARAAKFSGLCRVCLGKWSKQAGLGFVGNAHARVLDFDIDAVFSGFDRGQAGRADLHSALEGEFDRVADEVGQNLPDAHRVAQ